MIKAVASAQRQWICSACVRHATRRPLLQSRWHSALSRSASTPQFEIPVDNSSPNKNQDDALLRQLFDAPSPPQSKFARAIRWDANGPSVGLFKNRYLTSPDGFLTFAQRNVERAAKIVDRVLSASSVQEYSQVVRQLDRLSDLLCRVLDLSDFVRMSHPDMRFQQAASSAWSLVYQYMNQLNTTTGLNDQLCVAMEMPEVWSAWSEEEKAVAEMLKSDFMKSAVHLPKKARDEFVELSQEISEVGSEFVATMRPEQRTISLPSSKFMGLHPGVAASLTRRGTLYLPITGSEASMALRTVRDESTRRAIFNATRTASRRTIGLLDHMLRRRSDLAKLVGFESYADQALKDRMMAKSPASVMQFLLALRKRNGPVIQREIQDLVLRKEALGGRSEPLKPWDKEYYMESIRSEMRSTTRRDDVLSAYFSVGTVIQGLSRLFDRLYGIRLVPRDALPGETWHEDVRRLDVVTDTGNQVAVLYCDLFYRDGKSPNPAHFTVRCSREISPDEIEEAAAEITNTPGLPTFDSPESCANDGMEAAREDGILKQLPTIALVCDFPKDKPHDPSTPGEPALLSFFQVETLFHEMGHAIHSILARTSLQNVAGTRCATDFAELPSTLTEHFAADPSVLALFARHWRTDAPLPHDLVTERIRLSKRFEGFDTEHQVLLAMLDQAYHSPSAADPHFDSTAVYHALQKQYAYGPVDPDGTCWQGFFGHLHGYGSTYYSYLFDQVLAERVWRVVFRAGEGSGAIDRANGEKVKENLLRWGGSRDPWLCLADTLGDERLAAGDEGAMAIVGSWGIKDVEKA